MIHIETYQRTSEQEKAWNGLVEKAKNATFLFDRRYMDYHQDRFCDVSLLFHSDKGELIGALPANWMEREKTVVSHGGLTYGGLILSGNVTATDVLEMLTQAVAHYRKALGAEKMVYRPIPYIYTTYPAQEDLYALFRLRATLSRRLLSSAIYLPDAMRFHRSRITGTHKAAKEGLYVEESNDVEAFWVILSDVLQQHHNVLPVHTSQEMKMLMGRFETRIRLFGVMLEGRMVAGTVVYDMGHTVHTQYMACSDEGRRHRALDLLLDTLVHQTYADRRYLDFGNSNEQGGWVLNEGLLSQKESFGGRGICYDSWDIPCE